MGKKSISISSAEVRDLLIVSMEDVYSVFAEVNSVYAKEKSVLDVEKVVKSVNRAILNLSKIKDELTLK